MQMLNKVEIERMYQLADVLETVPSADFDLGAWCLRQPHTAVTVTGIVIRAGCGFAGCAMGWAVHTGMFPGLKVENGCLYYRDESGLEVTGFDAAATVFGITPSVASFLFAPVQYRFHAPATDVAARLRRFAEIVERRLARHPMVNASFVLARAGIATTATWVSLPAQRLRPRRALRSPVIGFLSGRSLGEAA
jgi:hypothetical protein